MAAPPDPSSFVLHPLRDPGASVRPIPAEIAVTGDDGMHVWRRHQADIGSAIHRAHPVQPAVRVPYALPWADRDTERRAAPPGRNLVSAGLRIGKAEGLATRPAPLELPPRALTPTRS
jgi:hypothetical protein